MIDAETTGVPSTMISLPAGVLRAEAARRPGMRFVAGKTEEQQAAGMVFRTRDLLVRQRTLLINALRGHLAEYGWVAPRGKAQMAMLADLLDEYEIASSLPEGARAMFRIMTGTLACSAVGSLTWTRKSHAGPLGV